MSAEHDPEWVAISRLDRAIDNILTNVNCSEYKLFVSGKGNFRNEIDPNYKANRTQPAPKWRESCKEHLIQKWGAIGIDGLEADDLCGVYQNESSIICGIDKDLLQIPGKHYSWEITRSGKVVREACFRQISEIEGLRNFYKQMLIGDTSDNIIGVEGIGPVKAAKILDHLDTEEEMRDTVEFFYSSDLMVENIAEGEKRCIKNANLLWIMREMGVMYEDR